MTLNNSAPGLPDDERSINHDYAFNIIDEIGEIGQDGEGVTRLAYTEEESRAHARFIDICPEDWSSGCFIDKVGNLYVTPWPEADSFCLIIGHLDSVPQGGDYDGVVGAALGAAVARACEERQQVDPAPLVAIFRAEESSRFGRAQIGSRIAMGEADQDILELEDHDGVTLQAAMENSEFSAENVEKTTIDQEKIVGALECHISQGVQLEKSEADLGIVTGIAAPLRYRVVFNGRRDHAGTTEAEQRQDANAAAGKSMGMIRDVEHEYQDSGWLKTNPGVFEADDMAVNVVNGHASIVFEVRSDDYELRESVKDDIIDRIKSISARYDVEPTFKEKERSPPAKLSPEIVHSMERATRQVDGTTSTRMTSGAGHDSLWTSKAGIPTGLLFIPCVDGRSHCPEEAIYSGTLKPAGDTLLHTLSSL